MLRRHSKWARRAGILLGAGLVHLVSCNELAGINPPKLCETDSDCASAPEPGCAACNLGLCEITPAGEPLSSQTAGDCKVRVCDGRGGIDPNTPDDTDLPQNENPCSTKSCVAGTLKDTPLNIDVPGCYSGPAEFSGIGACALGLQQCLEGVLSEACIGSVLPRTEACGHAVDLDCDGEVNETSGCCGDGTILPPEGCDDKNTDENDGCLSDCTIKKVLVLKAGVSHTCVIVTGGQVKCWGLNSNGQLGQGTEKTPVGGVPGEMGAGLPAVSLGDGQKAFAIDAGGAHACALLTTGDVANTVLGDIKCWGKNDQGQLGAGSSAANVGRNANELGNALNTVNLGAGAQASRIDVGTNHTCAILGDKSLKCWGANPRGQLGLGDTASRGTSPAQLGDNLPAVDLGTGEQARVVACGADHSCALLESGKVKCWGANGYGQLGVFLDQPAENRGDGPSEMGDQLPPVPLGAKATVISVGRHHSCAVLEGGTITCWGLNNNGQLGESTAINTSATMSVNMTPVSVDNQWHAITVSVGGRLLNAGPMPEYGHSCALLANFSVKCWGSNLSGQMGQIPTGNNNKNWSDFIGESIASLPVLNLAPTPTAISAGGQHTCVLLANGSVKCWGENMNAQLGSGSIVNYGDNAGETTSTLPPVNLFGPSAM